MKYTSIKLRVFLPWVLAMVSCLSVYAQTDGDDATTNSPEATEATEPEPEADQPKKVKPTKVFPSAWLIDNQTVTVPVKSSSEFDILHRFGPAKNGYKDFFGFFAASNISLRYSYVPVEGLMIGTALTKANMTWEFFVKYALIKQTKGTWWKYFSLTYYGNMGVESRKKDFYINKTDRLSYFNQLILARRFHERIAVQIAPSWTHYNVVDGYFSEPGVVSKARKHDHFAIAISGSIMLKKNMNLMIDYNQPLTKHKSGNPHPSLGFGLEFVTSAHAFQVFATHYYSITPQRNNYFNGNDWKYYLVGFNITRLW